MGNESSHGHKDDDYGKAVVSKEFENVILPQMVLIIEHVLWRSDATQHSTGFQGNLDYSQKSLTPLDRSYQSIQSTKPGTGPLFGPSSRIWCTASLDGRILGPEISFPSSGSTPPLKVNPTHPGSILSLKFRMDPLGTVAPGEITIPLFKLVRYGAPLFTTLWLALPLDGDGYEAQNYDLGEAVAKIRNPNLPKVCITLFKPIRREDWHGLAVDPQPDVHGALVEDMDTCVGPAKRGPTAIQQIKGLHYSLRTLSQMIAALQEALFLSPDERHGDLARQIQDTMRSITQKPDTGYAPVDVGSFWQVQEMLRKMEAEKEQWRNQLESKDRELQRRSQERAELDNLRIEFNRQKDELERKGSEVGEVRNLTVQLEMEKRMNQRLQEDITNLQRLDVRRLSITQDHAVASEELVRLQASLSAREKELLQLREERDQAQTSLRSLPTLETKVHHLEAELKFAQEKADALNTKCWKQEQELAYSKSDAAALHKRLEDQSNQVDSELKALRSSASERIRLEEELGRLRVEAAHLRSEKKMLTEDLETESHRWKAELEALRTAKDQQAELQEELTQKSMELEVLRVSQNTQKNVFDAMAKNAEEQEVRNKFEDEKLEETLTKLKQSAPKGLKDLREECAALRIKDKEREVLKKEYTSLKLELAKKEEEIRSLREARRRMEASLQESVEELERKKGEVKAMRAELEVQRTGEMLQKETLDNMRNQIEGLKNKDSSVREDLQEELAKASAELKVLRAKLQTSEFETYAEGRAAADPPGIVTV
mmetsp:Transcript_68179/g.107331  ORF Transcript_68179/g.107331 Transcript_68179/m.107331 type:complete len:773 (-) Transcript_68179:403-2721(-)